MTTTTAPSKPAAKKLGFSLTEVMVATSVGSIIIAAALSSLVFIAKSSVGTINYNEMNSMARMAAQTFGSDMRMVKEVTNCSPTSISARLPNYDVTYTYDAGQGTLTRTVNGQSRVLLRDAVTFDLQFYKMSSKPEGEVTSSPLEVKKVQLVAHMRRKALSLEQNDHIISSRFVLRNKAVTN